MVSVTAVRIADFHSPAGTGYKFTVSPTAQIGIGLPFGTELKIRYVPKLKVKEYGDISLFGLGLMHSITQYIPGSAMLPFDLSVFGGYTKLLVNVPISMQPADYTHYTTPYNAPASFAGQYLATTIKAFNASLVGSVNCLFLLFTEALGIVRQIRK